MADIEKKTTGFNPTRALTTATSNARAPEQPASSLSEATQALDVPAREALACLSTHSDGFTAPGKKFIEETMRACQTQRPTLTKIKSARPEAQETLVLEAVGRALGSSELDTGAKGTHRVGVYTEEGRVADVARGLVTTGESRTRKIATFQFESSQGPIRVMVGFSPKNGTQFGTYEFIFERKRAKNPSGAPFTDFFLVQNFAQPPKPSVPLPNLCESCHAGGQAILPPSPWFELSPYGQYEQNKGRSNDEAAGTFDATVRVFSTLVDAKTVVASLGEGDFELRKLMMRLYFGRAKLAAEPHVTISPDLAQRLEARFHQLPQATSDLLAIRDPVLNDPLELKPGLDPLVPRPTTRNELRLFPFASPFEGNDAVVRQVKSALGGRVQAFLDSKALAEVLVTRWPCTANDLLAAVAAFQKNAAAADVSEAQRRVVTHARSGRVTDKDLTPFVPERPMSAPEATLRFCISCHFGNGVVPKIDPANLQAFSPTAGKPDRTIENMISNGLMPPLGAAPNDARAMQSILDVLPKPTVKVEQPTAVSETLRDRQKYRRQAFEYFVKGLGLRVDAALQSPRTR